MKLKSTLAALLMILMVCSCHKNDPSKPEETFPPDIANAWMQLHIQLTLSTTGYNSIVSDRSFAYAGITLYESLVPGIPTGSSLLAKVGGTPLAASMNRDKYYWPASLNAAMASITRSFFESTSAANLQRIDSLENAWKAQFASKSDADKIKNAETYGRQLATSIFEWSKSDGGHEAYKKITDPTYIPPTGAGLWIPTAPAFAQPVHPRWGENRSFIPNSAQLTQPAAPLAYDEKPGSPFYNMVDELYQVSLKLTREDTVVARFWGDQPGNLNVPAHATNILIQLINLSKFNLAEAAEIYALHGIAMNEAAISVFKTKYKYNLIRPISYIRSVFKVANWNSVIPTPPHPEYAAAHSVVSAASATVLESYFGKNYKFTDHSYDATYGARTYNSFEDYAKEAGRARLLAGVHYSPSISIGLAMGNQLGALVVKLKTKK